MNKTLAAVPTSAMQPASETDLTNARVAESLVLRGDISALSPDERIAYYLQTCKSLGLNPASQPFAFLRLNGKEIMYPTRGTTDQLAANARLNREIIDGPKIVDIGGTKIASATCRATHPNGRVETAMATLPVSDPANLFMKLETKAKRRATLSILGLGMLDEMEVESIPAGAKAPSAMGPMPGAEVEAEATPVTALDYLRDDLASAETLDAVRAAWADHSDAVARMDDDGALGAARRALCERVVELGLARSSTEADALLKNPERPALLADYERSIDATVESDAPARAIVVAWVAWRDRVSKLPAPYAGHAKRYAVQAYAAALAVDEKEGAKQLAAAIKKHDATPPPDGSDPKAAKPRAVAPAADAKSEGGESSGAPANSQARAPHADSAPYIADPAAWRARCVRYSNSIEARKSWEKHVPAFRAAGVFHARREVAVQRLMMLTSIIDEAVAGRVLDDAERAADAAARVRAEAQRTGKSETTVMRRMRDANERPLRKVA